MTAGIIVLYLATFVGLVSFMKTRPIFMRLLSLLLVLTSLNETLVSVMGKLINSVLFYNVYSLVEMICWIIMLVYINAYANKKVHYSFLGLILLTSVAEIYYKTGFHSYSYRAFSVYVVASCLYYLYQLTETKNETTIRTNGLFWILSGLLIFHLIFLFYLTALDFAEFRKAKDALTAFRSIFNLINIIYYLLLSYGLLCLSFLQR